MAAPRMRGELPLILASLFIASVIWLIAKQSDYEPDQMEAAVKLENVPPYMNVDANPSKVGVQVQYPKTMSNQISDKHFSVPINVKMIFDTEPDQWTPPNSIKEKEYKLDTGSVKSDLAQAVQVVSVDQDKITLTAQLRTLAADVTVNTVGELPDNLMLVGKPQPDPAQLQFYGPREELEKLAASGKIIKTEPVDLAILHASGQLSRRVILPKGLKLLGRQMVTINIAVAEKTGAPDPGGGADHPGDLCAGGQSQHRSAQGRRGNGRAGQRA